MDAVSGRYSMPAVWGADLGLAGLLAMLGMVRLTWWRRGAMAGLIAGLVAVAIANVGKQDKFAARARLLWQTLEYVEREAPDGTRLGWMSRPEASVAGPAQASSNACLDVEEGVHFNWHLHARRRHDLLVGLCDEALRPTGRTELAPLPDGPTWLIGGDAHVPGSEWRLREAFAAPYWSGRRSFHCFLFEKISPPSQQN
jgi:hypothetical protein